GWLPAHLSLFDDVDADGPSLDTEPDATARRYAAVGRRFSSTAATSAPNAGNGNDRCTTHLIGVTEHPSDCQGVLDGVELVQRRPKLSATHPSSSKRAGLQVSTPEPLRATPPIQSAALMVAPRDW